MRNRLKHYRAQRGLSQAELAGQVGVSRQTLNAIETDKYDPSLKLAYRLSRVLGARVVDLFEDPDDPWLEA